MDEFARIRHFFAPLAQTAEALALTDDAAFFASPPQGLVISTDTLIADVHFFADDAPSLIAQKALRVNLSDLAAKGASPYGYFLNLSIPAACDDAWLKDFCNGLHHAQQAFDLSLLGGDSTQSQNEIVISITVIGSTGAASMLQRSKATIGDDVWVSGFLGSAAIGLKMRSASRSISNHCTESYLLPQPRIVLGQKLLHLASAAMDISDGLLQDADHLCHASGVGMELSLSALPLHPDAAAWIADYPEDELIHCYGGDDYELLFTAPANLADTILAAGERLHVNVTRIGYVTEGESAQLYDANGSVINPIKRGYQHY